MGSEFIKCTCQHCSGRIEFSMTDLAALPKTDLGVTSLCPHCGMETLIYAPNLARVAETPKEKAPTKPRQLPPPVAKKYSFTYGHLGALVSMLLGLALIFEGCVAEMSGTSVMHQTYGAIQYCSGFILFALGLVISLLANIANKG